MRTRLTKYDILGALASGGMADVWLARVSGPAGFNKLIVVKTIRPNLAGDPAFVNMLFHEARVAAMLNHPNCVQIFDVGEDGGTAYIAMEFIDGFTLARVLRQAELKRLALPVPLLARILMDAASGLDHAHHLADAEGKPAGLVHRDVSLANILVSFGGQTKVVDFGIAKAVRQHALGENTQVGILKGKAGYMAPEYLLGNPIDARADLFALGVVLYRSLTGARPFRGETDAEIADAVMFRQPVPPRKLRPQLSAELEAVVLKALAKQPAERFESARAMRKAIERAVGRAADTDDVATAMERLWPVGDAERSSVQTLASGAPREHSDPVLNSIISANSEVPVTNDMITQSRAAAAVPTPRKGPHVGIKVGVAAVLAVASLAGTWLLLRPAETPESEIVPEPRGTVVVAHAAVGPTGETLDGGAESATTTHSESATPSEGSTGLVEVASAVPMEVTVGTRVLGRTPGPFELEVGPQVLKLQNRDLGLAKRVSVVVDGGKTQLVRVPIGRGSLDVRVSPWAVVKIDGRMAGTTPLPPQDVLEGRHVLELSNPRLGRSKKIAVSVAPGERKVIRETFD